MTSIKFFKQTGVTSQSIAAVKHFLEMQPYTPRKYEGTDASFFLLTLRPEIRKYMTSNLFAQKTAREKVREIDLLGVTAAPAETGKGRPQHISLAGTEEEFKAHLATMEDIASKIEAARNEFEERRKKLLDDLTNTTEVKALKIPASITDPLAKDAMPRTAPDFQNAFQKSVESLPKIFELIRSRVLKKIDEDLGKIRAEWQAAADLLEENEERFVDKYGDVNPQEFLDYYADYDAQHYLAEALKTLDGMGDARIQEIDTANQNQNLEARRKALLTIYNEYIKDKNQDQVNEIETVLLDTIVSSYKALLEENEEPLGVINDLEKLESFYENLLSIVEFMEVEQEKLTNIDGYIRDGKPTGRDLYQPIRDAEKEQEKSRQLGIPYVGYLTTFYDELPDFSGIVYVPKTLRQYPIPEEAALLNELDGMIIKHTRETERRIEGREEGSRTFKETKDELTLVGYLVKPGYMIKVKSVGLNIEAEMYEGNSNSLPSQNKSIEEYLDHCSAFRERRRGKVYCVFYIDRKPYAADEEHIYSLAPRSHTEFAVNVPKQLADLYEYVSSASRTTATFAEIVRRLDEIYSVAQASTSNAPSWRSSNIQSFSKLESLQLLAASLSQSSYESFVGKVSALVAATSASNQSSKEPQLDLYTYEALLYAFELSKVNLEQKDAVTSNHSNSVHTPETFITASVRRPDDLFYNKSNGLPYDVLILRHNISPRPIIAELMQTTFTKRKKVKTLDSTGREKVMSPDYPDRAWTRKAKGFNTTRMELPPLEVFDIATMSKTIYCNPNDYALEVLTGPSLRLDDVIARLNLLSRGKIDFRQYSLPADINGKLATYLKETLANPLFAHYLTAQDTEANIGENERKLVRQALRGIAYTLYCKLSASIGSVQDLTAVINSVSPNYSHCVFTHNILQRKNAQTPGMQLTFKPEGSSLTFRCVVESVVGEEARLMPLKEEPVRRTLSLDTTEERDEYYMYLESFLEQETRETKAFSETTSDPKRRKKIENIGVPELLRAQTIAHVLDKSIRKVSEEEVEKFIRNMNDGMQLSRVQSSTSVQTSYGLEVSLSESGNTITVEDTVLGEKKEFKLPFTMKTTITIEKKEKQEPTFDEPFVGSMDMTFLTLLDQAMYPGEHTLLNRLHGIYHMYETGLFSREVLGTFLWSEFVEKVWTAETIKRIYHLISYQPRNLILRTTERVTLRQGTVYDRKPLILARNKIQWL